MVPLFLCLRIFRFLYSFRVYVETEVDLNIKEGNTENFGCLATVMSEIILDMKGLGIHSRTSVKIPEEITLEIGRKTFYSAITSDERITTPR